ncbi:hypothetical protein TNCV_1418291 [Trichonephila clavipes]|nr:hypothetical protein TNCV_1418291 [Trichonephila clavipes]
MGRSDAAIRRCWQECVDSGRFQRHYSSDRRRTTEDREDILIVRSAITASDLSLSTIRCATCTRLSLHYDHSQTADRAKVTLVLTATPPFFHAYTLSR